MIKVKKDKYFRARGGVSKFLKLHCGHCGEYVALYQKDGHGNLFRLYLDRILEPESLANLQNIKEKSKIPSLKCPRCGDLIGVPMVYEPENRLAFRLIKGKIQKRKGE